MAQEASSTGLLLILFFVLFNFAFTHTIVKTLPGFNATLPFKLETGYISVGKDDDVQLFYYFVESERNPVKDPLVLWLTGGPGCSALSGLVYEIGPFSFDFEAFDGSLPSLLLNPYSWTKIANIIFLDSPVGSGFSYSTTAEGYYSSDTKAAKETYTFLQKWLLNHPSFIKHRLYIGADSYAGKMAPLVVTEITKGNEAGVKPRMILKGFFIGNPVTFEHQDHNERIPYAHRMGLISDQYYKLAESSCDGEYVTPDPENKQCLLALQLINMCVDNIYLSHILEPNCELTEARRDGPKAFPGDESSGILLPSDIDEPWCPVYNHVTVYVWANDPTVREALQIRKGTKGIWRRCNKTLAYEKDVESAVPYLQYLSKIDYEALIYSGDHDMSVPYLSTLKSIGQLNLTPDENWRPWFVNGQIAGYTEKFKEKRFSLTFATVKGAGHTAAGYNPKECFAMINRWLSSYAL